MSIPRMREELMNRHPKDVEWKLWILAMSNSEVRALYNILEDWKGGYGQYE